MRVVQIAKDEIFVVHFIDYAKKCNCGKEAIVAVDHSHPIRCKRRYLCFEHYMKSELEEVELCLSKT